MCKSHDEQKPVLRKEEHTTTTILRIEMIVIRNLLDNRVMPTDLQIQICPLKEGRDMDRTRCISPWHMGLVILSH